MTSRANLNAAQAFFPQLGQLPHAVILLGSLAASFMT